MTEPVDTTATDAVEQWYRALEVAPGCGILISTDVGTEIEDSLREIRFAKRADGSIWPYALVVEEGQVVLLTSVVYFARVADAD